MSFPILNFYYRLFAYAFCLMLCFNQALYADPIKIVLWHSLAGQLGDELGDVAKAFNRSQNQFFIKPVYKGNYLETLTSFTAAFRAHKPPDLVQVFEVGTNTVLFPSGIIKPVYELMQEQGLTLPVEDFFPVVKEQYSQDGQLMAMPFNISIPVFFYNADALKKMNYSEKNFPKTWEEFERLAQKLNKSGFSCVYTSAYPSWILFESFSALHGLPMIVNHKAVYNHPKLVQFFKKLKSWQQKHYFVYSGRTDEGTFLFTSGRCPILSQSSGAYSSLASSVKFDVQMAEIPLDKEISTKRYNNVAGGAALWAVAGRSPKVYQGIAQFFMFLASPQIQKQWHERTGYLPLGVKGSYKTFTESSNHPALRLAKTELSGDEEAVVILGVQNQIRNINDQTLEAIMADIKSPQKAIDEAVRRSNHALSRFQRNILMGKQDVISANI